MTHPGSDTVILKYLDQFIFSMWGVCKCYHTVTKHCLANPALNFITLSPIASVAFWMTECRLALITYSRLAAKLPNRQDDHASPGPSAYLQGCSPRIEQSHSRRGKYTGIVTETGKCVTHEQMQHKKKELTAVPEELPILTNTTCPSHMIRLSAAIFISTAS